MSLQAAAEVLQVSYRQAKRLKKRFVEGDLAGLVHGNRGRPAANAVKEAVREHVVRLHEEQYWDTNDRHFTELLREREGLVIGRESVRTILRQAGRRPKRKRRPPRHHSRRPRRSRMGELVQIDGSPHRWFGPDQPPCCLMTAVDDATSTLLAALFVPVESSEAYLKLLAMLLRRHGIPEALYHDRHSSLVRSDDCWSHEEQLQGFQYPTHVGRAIIELGIESIAALSPQAKGKVERGFGVHQDRTLVELRLAGITDMENANAWLDNHYIDRHNSLFAVHPAETTSAFVPASPADIRRCVCFAYEATVANDNAVRLGGIVIDIPPGPRGRSYAKATVLVRQHLDGSWSVWHGNTCVATHEGTVLREPIRQWKPRTHRSSCRTRSVMQVYIASKPAPPSKGTFSLGR